MSFCNLILKSNLLTNGCKRYYQYLYNLQKVSVKQNWVIVDGKYENKNFVIAKDSHASSKLMISKSSIANYKKTLKALGLIKILPKFTTKTNICKNNHFCQLTVLADKPRQFISKLLVFNNKLKSIKATSNIISRFSKKIKSINGNIHSKINKIIFGLKSYNSSNNQYSNNYNGDKYLGVTKVLKEHGIKFKNNDLPAYYELYIKDKNKFFEVSKYCEGKTLFNPFKYFKKVFVNYLPITTLDKPNYKSFANFPQRKYDNDYLENLLIKNKKRWHLYG